MNGSVGRGRDRVRALGARERERHRARGSGVSERGPDLEVAFRRAESHHDVVRRRRAASSHARKSIDRSSAGQRPLADDHGMHELHRDVLRVGRVRTAAEGQQAAAAQEALRHLAAGHRRARTSLAREKRFAQITLRSSSCRPDVSG